jgi:hypothetical protein
MLYAGLNWAGSEQPRPIMSSPPHSSLASDADFKRGDEVLRNALSNFCFIAAHYCLVSFFGTKGK